MKEWAAGDIVPAEEEALVVKTSGSDVRISPPVGPDGGDLGGNYPRSKISLAPLRGKLARALFDDALRGEAEVRAERPENLPRVLDAMWSKTEPGARADAERQADRLIAAMEGGVA